MSKYIEAVRDKVYKSVCDCIDFHRFLKVPVPEPMKKHLETIQKDYNDLAKDRSKYAKRRKV